MKKKITLIITSLLTALATLLGLVVVAAPAQAATVSGLCWVEPTQHARLSVSRWWNGSSYTYHIDANGYYPTSGVRYTPATTYIDGVNQNKYNDYYAYRSTYPHTIKATWSASNGWAYSCSVRV